MPKEKIHLIERRKNRFAKHARAAYESDFAAEFTSAKIQKITQAIQESENESS